VGKAGWEEVADFALDWAIDNARYLFTPADIEAAFPPLESRAEPGRPEARM
jgi:hypothetical protein